MKTHVLVLLLGLCLLFGIPGVGEAALDWQIRWSDLESPQIAKVYIFNPEFTRQSFSLEIGDIAKTSSLDPNAPYLIVGQDVSLHLQPGERKIFDILVYQDIDPYNTYGAQGAPTYTLSDGDYQLLLEGRPSSSDSGQNLYPVENRAINPVPRESSEEYSYRNERGYWKLILVDHDHVVEQLIRTGNRMGASHNSIQQAILFYTQSSMALSTEAKKVWDSAFPEWQRATPTPTPMPCTYYVTFVAGNSTIVSIGDVLEPRYQGLSRVVAAEGSSLSTTGLKYSLQVFPMKTTGIPGETAEYLSIAFHDNELERTIRLGNAYMYSNCEIQNVILYLNKGLTSLTSREKALLDLVQGKNPNQNGGGTPCFGGRSVNTADLKAAPENWKNLAVLVGAIVPFGLIFRRRGRK